VPGPSETAASPPAPPSLLACCAEMAVPKQKQSHARTAKRRAQHKLRAPSYNACPQCHSPRLPHRVCPVCGHYKGREVIAPPGERD
jgi:large subunit ribosomal protein L32